jgi:hypothetical protein
MGAKGKYPGLDKNLEGSPRPRRPGHCIRWSGPRSARHLSEACWFEDWRCLCIRAGRSYVRVPTTVSLGSHCRDWSLTHQGCHEAIHQPGSATVVEQATNEAFGIVHPSFRLLRYSSVRCRVCRTRLRHSVPRCSTGRVCRYGLVE